MPAHQPRPTCVALSSKTKQRCRAYPKAGSESCNRHRNPTGSSQPTSREDQSVSNPTTSYLPADFYENPSFDNLSAPAEVLYIRALAMVKANGVIMFDDIHGLLSGQTKPLIDELVNCGLFIHSKINSDMDYQVRGWSYVNESNTPVLEAAAPAPPVPANPWHLVSTEGHPTLDYLARINDLLDELETLALKKPSGATEAQYQQTLRELLMKLATGQSIGPIAAA
jgi:hypothetical protein